MPFAVGPDARLLGARSAPGVLWIAALTAALLPIERLVEPDRADGVLDQLALRGIAEESVAVAKIVAHWLTFGPLLLIAARPGVASCLAMDGAALGRALRSRSPIGTPGLAALAVAVAALTAGLAARGSAGWAAAAAAGRAAADLRRGGERRRRFGRACCSKRPFRCC